MPSQPTLGSGNAVLRRGHRGCLIHLHRSVAVVERRYWGGVCLNVGCVPAKTLLRNAELGHILTREADTFGISGDITIDYGAAFRRSRSVSASVQPGGWMISAQPSTNSRV